MNQFNRKKPEEEQDMEFSAKFTVETPQSLLRDLKPKQQINPQKAAEVPKTGAAGEMYYD